MSGSHLKTAALPPGHRTPLKRRTGFYSEFLPIKDISCVSLPIRGVRKRFDPVRLAKGPVIPWEICVRARNGILKLIGQGTQLADLILPEAKGNRRHGQR